MHSRESLQPLLQLYYKRSDKLDPSLRHLTDPTARQTGNALTFNMQIIIARIWMGSLRFIDEYPLFIIIVNDKSNG